MALRAPSLCQPSSRPQFELTWSRRSTVSMDIKAGVMHCSIKRKSRGAGQRSNRACSYRTGARRRSQGIHNTAARVGCRLARCSEDGTIGVRNSVIGVDKEASTGVVKPEASIGEGHPPWHVQCRATLLSKTFMPQENLALMRRSIAHTNVFIAYFCREHGQEQASAIRRRRQRWSPDEC